METDKNIKTFSQQLDGRYGKTETEKRTNFEIKAKSFAIGELIKEERKLAHLTQQQLSTLYKRIELGRKINLTIQ